MHVYFDTVCHLSTNTNLVDYMFLSFLQHAVLDRNSPLPFSFKEESTFVLLLINSWGGYREYYGNILSVKRAPLITACANNNNNYNNNIIVIIINNIWSITVHCVQHFVHNQW